MKEFIKKVRNLPQKQKKIILWSVIIILAIGMVFWWLKDVRRRIKNFQKEELLEQLNIPALEEKLEEMKLEMPDIEAPEMSEEELKQMEETIKEAEQEK